MISGRKILMTTLASAWVLFSVASMAQTDSPTPDPTSLIESLEVPEGRVEFREEQHDPLLSSKLVSRGWLSRDEAGNLTKQTVFPRQEVVIIGADRIELQRNGDTRSFNPAQRPAMASLFTSLRALIGGDASTLTEHFTAAAETVESGWAINLIPKDEALLKRLEKLEVHGHEQQIRAIHTHMQDGSWQRLQLVGTAGTEPAEQ